MRKHINNVWLNHLYEIIHLGHDVSPRGKPTRELLQKTIIVDMRGPLLTIPERGLNYKFAAAEAFWILTGSNKVSEIAPWNSKIAQFSDDGDVFHGAYGPKIRDQLGHVISTLREDQNSRQAVINIWRENPPKTKDYPCTLNMIFMIRNGELNMHVNMRSSDAWLGIPYDVFSFSMVAHLICSILHMKAMDVKPGKLYLTAASSHLYEENVDAAIGLMEKYGQGLSKIGLNFPLVPEEWSLHTDDLMESLKVLRDTIKGNVYRWWEKS
jgi:thymidylate synthase